MKNTITKAEKFDSISFNLHETRCPGNIHPFGIN